MYGFQELFDSTLAETLADSENDRILGNIEARISDMMPDLIDDVSATVLEQIESRFRSGDLEDYWKDKRGFVERLRKHWKEPLDLFELFITLATEAGSDFNDAYRRGAVRSGDAVFEVLTRLHSRGCQISWAIHTLLRSGFADDAHARWRSLHEVAVVGSFISQHGHDLAEKYLLHDVIQRYKLACEHQRYKERINEKPVSKEEFQALKAEHDKLVDQFGKPFGKDYGWAANALGTARPTIRAIEEHVQLDHWRPYYKMASDNVHANSHGAYFKLGLIGPGRDVMLAGPSNAGLADPGHSAAISLHQVTTTMLSTRLSFDSLVTMSIFETMVEKIGEAFLESHVELEAVDIEKKQTEVET